MEFLGERSVMVENTSWAKKGQITSTTAVLSRDIADKLPKGWERAADGPRADYRYQLKSALVVSGALGCPMADITRYSGLNAYCNELVHGRR
ncbi:hypothetical protein [Streptomyces chartreusis]|uniref:hypothetical protein n=1 Tax=Streptomyces chartreusis TaxID=1969 RepID=UPI003820FB94